MLAFSHSRVMHIHDNNRMTVVAEEARARFRGALSLSGDVLTTISSAQGTFFYWLKSKERVRISMDSAMDVHDIEYYRGNVAIAETATGCVAHYNASNLRQLSHRHCKFEHRHHINTLRVFDGHLFVLAYNFGAPSSIHHSNGLINWTNIGRQSHGLVRYKSSWLVLDSAGLNGPSALVRLRDRGKREVVWSNCTYARCFLKGLAVQGDVAVFGVNKVTSRPDRFFVNSSLAYVDLLSGTTIQILPVDSRGLINTLLSSPRWSA